MIQNNLHSLEAFNIHVLGSSCFSSILVSAVEWLSGRILLSSLMLGVELKIWFHHRLIDFI